MYMCIKPCGEFKDGDKVVVVATSPEGITFLCLTISCSVCSPCGGFTFYTRPIYSVSWSEFKECFIEVTDIKLGGLYEIEL